MVVSSTLFSQAKKTFFNQFMASFVSVKVNGISKMAILLNIFDLLLVSINCGAVVMSIYWSLTKNIERDHLLEIICDFDKSIKASMDRNESAKNSERAFTIYYLISLSSIAVHTYIAHQHSFSGVYNSFFSIVFLNHYVHISSFHYSTYTKAVEIRLEKFRSEVKNFKFHENQRNLVKLFEINHLMNKNIRWPLMVNFAQLYATILINFYWLGCGLLEIHQADLTGNVESCLKKIIDGNKLKLL